MNIITYDNFLSLCNHYLCDEEELKKEMENYNFKVDQTKIIDYCKFKKCLDNKDLVFVFNYLLRDIEGLIKKLSLFKNKFKIILFHEDGDVKENILQLFKINNLIKIYGRNLVFHNNNVIMLPLGLARYFFPHGDLSKFHKVINMKIHKNKGIFFNFSIGTNPTHRQDCYDKIKAKGIKWIKRNPFEEYIKELASHKFCISPEGNGIDCHRTWEALYLKTIPICKKSSLTENFSKIFPIVLVDDWNNIPCLRYTDYSWDNYDKLEFNYWKNVITS